MLIVCRIFNPYSTALQTLINAQPTNPRCSHFSSHALSHTHPHPSLPFRSTSIIIFLAPSMMDPIRVQQKDLPKAALAHPPRSSKLPKLLPT